MERATRTGIVVVLSFAAGILLTLGLQHLYAQGGFLKDTVDTVTREPRSATKLLFFAALLLVVAAVPLGVLEWRAERRFLREEHALRAQRPADAVTRYEGPEGRGFLFDGPEGRLLLLEPTGMLGAPTRVELPPVPPAPGHSAVGEIREPS